MPTRLRDVTWPAALSRLRRGMTTRVRLFGAFIVLIVFAVAIGLLVQRSLLLRQLDEAVDEQLRQEVEELGVLSTARDPETGEPFAGNVEAIFDTFLGSNVPASGEALFTLVGGEPFASTVAPAQLLNDVDLVASWAALREPAQDDIDTEAGRVRYLAVPAEFNDEVVGTFVVAVFMEDRLDAIGQVIRTGIVTYGIAIACASALAWFVAGQVLRPLNQLTEAAHSVSESDWTRRIDVAGDDQIAFLARTFNEMLDRLEAAFEAQRRLIDDAGHELRTPITVIRGHLELMEDDPAAREETLRLVMDELARMGRMVDDLLLLARADHADFLLRRPFDVDDLVDDIALKARMLDDRGWEVTQRASVVVEGDQQRVTQALMNLCRNAVEHTPPGTSVRLGSEVRGGQVGLWVEDDGPGISHEDQQRIFERFATGPDASLGADGAGLGLAIAKVIADAHGGDIVLDSAPGEGARFTLYIPIEAPLEDAPV